MHRNLIKLLGRAGVYCAPLDGEGNDLGGDNPSAEEVAAAAAAKATADEAVAAAEAAALAAKGKEPDADKPGNKPSDAEAKLLKELMALKEKSRVAAEELNALKGALGDTKADDIKVLLEQKKEADRLALEKRGEYDRILEQVKAEHVRELGTLSEQVEAMRLQLSEKDSSLVDLTVGRAFSESIFIREKSRIPASIARKEFGSHVDIVDGSAVVYDKPRGAAERTPIVDGTGKPKSFEDGIQALYAAHADAGELIRAQAKPGAGSQNDDLGGKKPADKSKDVAPGASRIAQALNNRK